jgi:response regulator RpfG family c-di-GMP phosphodiesterase
MPNDTMVLYVEDNPQNMRLVRKFLKMGGYKLIEAETGEEGLVKAREEAPSLI